MAFRCSFAALGLAALVGFTGCSCGTFEAWLPGNDRSYTGHEVCGGSTGSFGSVGAINSNEFALHMNPRVHGTAARREEMNNYLMVTYMRREEMVAGAFPELDPWGMLSGAPVTDGEIEVLDYELKENEGSSDLGRWRLRWDLLWGEEEGDAQYLHYEGTDWVEAFL
jgi:hypothetical protein